MNCMKCGRELKEGQVFCDECLVSMEHEPVKLNTPVLIPAQPPKKSSPRRQVVNPEDEVVRLEKLNQNLFLILVLLFTTTLLLLGYVFNQEVLQVVEELGRNYSVIGEATLP